MILTNIAGRIKRGEIIVKAPYDLSELKIGANSLDVTLGGNIYLVNRNLYMAGLATPVQINTQAEPSTSKLELEFVDSLGKSAYILYPNCTYLAVTREWVAAGDGIVCTMHTRSTAARWGIDLCKSAGFGDVGFAGHWTLEITVCEPTLVWEGMRIGQLAFHEAEKTGKVYGGNYANPYTDDPHPVFPKAGNM